MLRPMFFVTLLVAIPGPTFGQPADQTSRALWPHMHTCSVDTGAGWFHTAPKAGRAATASPHSESSLDLQFEVNAPAPGSMVPTVTAHAINTKGTGVAGRTISPGGPVTITCTSRRVASNAGAQESASPSVSFASSGQRGAAWSCIVSGSEKAPHFTLNILVPSSGPQTTNWSWGATNSGSSSPPKGYGAGRVSIIPRGTGGNSVSTIECSSKEQRAVGYDLAFSKRA